MDSSVEDTVRLTPVDRENIRKSQYKSGRSSSTPEWRSSYRKRCKERLTRSRERLISRFRNIETEGENSPGSSKGAGVGGDGARCGLIGSSSVMDMEDPVRVVALSVEEAMKEEWEHMRAENSELPLLPNVTPRKRILPFPDTVELKSPRLTSPYVSSFCSDDEFDSDDVNSILTIIEELTQELILEEQSMLLQYQERQEEVDQRLLEETSLNASTDSDSSSVICPICQKNFLLQDVRNIYCTCGMQINTIHDGLTLRNLQEQLELCVSQHGMLCTGRPVFSLECTLGIQNIIMNCTVCDFMYVVL